MGGSAEEIVEALHVGHELGPIGPRARSALPRSAPGHVPFADKPADITAFRQDFRYRPFLGVKHGVRAFRVARLGEPNGIAAGKQRRPGRPAYILGVEASQPHPLVRHAINIRRANMPVAVAGEIAVAEIVGEDHDKIRRSLRKARGSCQDQREQACRQARHRGHCNARASARRVQAEGPRGMTGMRETKYIP